MEPLDIRSRTVRLVCLLVTGCATGEAPTGPVEEPPPVLVDAQVVFTTTGATPDADGYRISVDGVDRGAARPNDTTVFELPLGTRELEVSGVQANCDVEGGVDRVIEVFAGATFEFGVDCPLALVGGFTFSRRFGGFADRPFFREFGNGVETELFPGEGGYFSIQVSPDGRRILGQAGGLTGGAIVAAVDGSYRRDVAPSNGTTGAWAPTWIDRDRVAFALQESFGLDYWVARADGSEAFLLLDEEFESFGQSDWWTDASRFVVEVTTFSPQGRFEQDALRVYTSDGSPQHELYATTSNLFDPIYVDALDRVFFTVHDRSRGYFTYSIRPDGADLVELPSPDPSHYIGLSDVTDDGLWILYDSLRPGGGRQLIRARIDFSDPVVVLETTEHLFLNARFTPPSG
ncbi:MAG: hypothetical protein R3195_10535 [Gemmatimonadota bacterium]|nr:hypothetical protein [Gemmatimonadota bacterium]